MNRYPNTGIEEQKILGAQARKECTIWMGLENSSQTFLHNVSWIYITCIGTFFKCISTVAFANPPANLSL